MDEILVWILGFCVLDSGGTIFDENQFVMV
jgi:hypothetical protein